VGFVNFPMDRFVVIGPDWEEGRIIIHKNVDYPGVGSPCPKNFMGAVIVDINDSISNYTGRPENSGIYLEKAPVGSNADSVGFITGDIIIAFNGDPVENVDTSLPLFESRPLGEVPVVVFRKGNKVMLTITTFVRMKKRFDYQLGRDIPPLK